MVGKKDASGRKSVKGFRAIENQYKRTSVTIQFKKAVLDFFETNSAPVTISKFWPELVAPSSAYETKRRLIYQWKKNTNKIQELSHSNTAKKLKKIRPMGISTQLPHEIEDELYFWVRSIRKEGVPITDDVLCRKTLILCKQNNINVESFKMSKSWVARFKKAHMLSLRSKTHQGQTSLSLPNSLADQFAIDVRNKMAELNVNCIWNADQVAVNYETVPSRTLNEIGAKTIWIKTAGKEKERVSVLLLASSNGQKKTPFVIFKGKPSTVSTSAERNAMNQHGFGARVWKDIKNICQIMDVEIYCNQKAWFTSDIMVKWLKFNFSNDISPKLLILDDFTAHWTENVLTTARELNVTIMKIPPGLTGICQPADISWNKPFKSNIRNKWSEKLRSEMEESQNAFRSKPPSRTNIVQWITSSWSQLSSTTIVSGFIKPGYIENIDVVNDVNEILVVE